MQKIYQYIFICLCFLQAYAENGTQIVSLNESWKFNLISSTTTATLSDTVVTVNLPHCWGIKEATDDKPGYSRAIGLYKKEIFVPAGKSSDELYLCFEGANQTTEVFVNGKPVGRHQGGYTRFYVDITRAVNFGHTNLLEVKVNNLPDSKIPPLSADFTFFGGIHRDVYLVRTNKTHFDFAYGAKGIFVTSSIQNNNAQIHIKGHISNGQNRKNGAKIEVTVQSATDLMIDHKSSVVSLNTLQKSEFSVDLQIDNPILWSPENPYLYKVIVRMTDVNSGELLDEQIQPLGIRSYRFDPDKGFFLNGEKLKLIGVNRHQSFENRGFAMDDALNVNDIRMIKEMGANFLRISHYPQDPVILDMCDKLGIICSVEIPVVNEISETPEFTENTLQMAREMVYQDFNHPSVVMWAYMNEILLVQPFKNNPELNKTYQHAVLKLAGLIQKEIRNADPDRPTMIPCHGDLRLYTDAGITAIPDIIGWNLYQGWYVGEMTDFEKFLVEAKHLNPTKAIIVSEYGADTDVRVHSFDPVRFDYSNEYAVALHSHYLDVINKTDFVAGAAIWNFNDFYSESRINAIPHVNTKGLVTLNRETKDTYRFYKVALSQKPKAVFSSIWTHRAGNSSEFGYCIQPISVFTNTDSIELTNNGIKIKPSLKERYISSFNIPFINGKNRLELSINGKVVDYQVVEFDLIPFYLKDNINNFQELNVMLGSQRYYEDKAKSIIWIPEQEYKTGSWGYIGGHRYIKKTRNFDMPLTDADILNTTDEPLYQTQREDIESFRVDVPNGEYSVEFFWAELQSDKELSKLANNLGNEFFSPKIGKRVFSLNVNDIVTIENVNLAGESGFQTSLSKKLIINVVDGRGLNIIFTGKIGLPVLNAIRILKCK